MLETSTNQELLAAWRSGNEHAAQILVRRYMARLTALARSRLSRKLARRLDPEDIVLSAWRSFFVAVNVGRASVTGDDDLWPLLVTMTLRKLSRQNIRQTARRRDLREEIGVDEFGWQTVVSRDPSPEQAAILVDEVETLMSQLEVADREILSRRLRGEQQAEIAAALKCSERTIRRGLQRIREQFLSLQENIEEADHLSSMNVILEQTPGELIAAIPTVLSETLSLNVPTFEYRDLQLQTLVGQGRFGKVYQAIELRNGSTVAVKFLKKQFWRDARAVLSLLEETSRTTGLLHPNIIRHIGWGRSPHGGMFAVMEWINGNNVGAWVKHQVFSLQEVLECGNAIADALMAAHAAGITHGDVTPSNVLRRNDGTFVLTDFGFAQSLSDPQRTFLGGTPGFLAPEQISDAFGPVSERTDVYGLGGLIYSLITGNSPSTGDDLPEILANTLSSHQSIRSSQAARKIPEELDQIIMACLRKEPRERPASVEEVREILRRISIQLKSSRTI